MHHCLQDYDSSTASISNLGQSTFVDFIAGEDAEEKVDPRVQPGGNLWDYMYNLRRYLAQFVSTLSSSPFNAINENEKSLLDFGRDFSGWYNFGKVVKIVAIKMHQIRFRLRLWPRPRWGSLQRSPRPPSWI